MEPRLGNRIVIIGSSNAGKTTLGTHIAAARGVPFVDLDALHWEPNWTPAKPDVFRKRISEAIRPDAWVLAGNYTTHKDLSWSAADTIIWLDLPLHLVLRRCVARTWRRWRTKEVLYGDNVEDFREHLSFWDPNKSLLTYTLLNHRKKRRAYSGFMTDPAWPHLTFIRLRSVAEVNELARQVSGHTHPGTNIADGEGRTRATA